MAFQLKWSTVCDECDGVMGEGEWAEYTSGPSRAIRHAVCPRQPKTCPDCFLQHNGECP